MNSSGPLMQGLLDQIRQNQGQQQTAPAGLLGIPAQPPQESAPQPFIGGDPNQVPTMTRQQIEQTIEQLKQMLNKGMFIP